MLSAVEAPWTDTRPGSFGNREEVTWDSGQERPSNMALLAVVVMVVETLTDMLMLKAGCTFTGCLRKKSILDKG